MDKETLKKIFPNTQVSYVILKDHEFFLVIYKRFSFHISFYKNENKLVVYAYESSKPFVSKIITANNNTDTDTYLTDQLQILINGTINDGDRF